MSQFFETATRPDTAAGALGQYLRVKTPGALALASSTDQELGTMEIPCLAAGPATVRLRTAQGTVKMVAAGAITAGNPCYAAASGKIDASGTVLIGIALETSTTTGDVIEVLRRQETSDSTASGGTTAAAFLVDNDSAIPKIELASYVGGTGDYKVTLKPAATITANRTATFPDVTDTVVMLGLAQTLTNKTLTSPTIATTTGTVAAGGTAIGNANAVAEGVNYVTGSDDTAAVILPASVAGKTVVVKNSVANKVLIVFPPVSSQVNAKGLNNAYNMAAGTKRVFHCYNSTLWLTDLETIG